jgi:hypothetical protein
LPKLRDKFERSDKSTRKKVFQVIIGGLVLLVLIIGGIFISNSVFPSGHNEIKQIEIDDHIHEEYKNFEDLEKLPEDQIYDYIEIPEEEQEPDAGRGIDLPSIPNPLDALNPFSGFQESVRDAFSEIIQQGLELFDDYVAFTPNIAKGDGDIVDARGNQISFGVNKFYNATRTIAFLLLPIVIVITGITIVLEGRMKGTQILMQSGKKVLLFMIAMVSLRFIFSLFIDLNNSISRYVLQTLVGLPGIDTLSESLLVAFGMNISDGKLEFSLEGALNLFGEIILWIGLFFLLMTLLFQFIIRFFHLLIHLIVFPIVLIIIAKKRGLYSYQQSLSRLILKLEDAGYLRGFLYGNNWKVVYITKKGAKRLAFEQGIPISDISIPNQGQRVQFTTLEHTVKIAKLYASVFDSLKPFSNISINKWVGDQHIICQYSFRSNRSGKNIRRNLMPDSYFEILKDEEIFSYFLEYDTGTMDKAQLVPKFMRYFEYYVYGDWKDRFKQFPTILFLTDRSEVSMDNIFQESSIDLEKALSVRKEFGKSENVIWQGIGASENIRSINSSHIRDFLSQNIILDFTNKPWTESLLSNVAR